MDSIYLIREIESRVKENEESGKEIETRIEKYKELLKGVVD